MSNEQRNGAGDYVIQRASETLCEWWTGSEWTEHWGQARRFAVEPDAANETGDESAKAKKREDANAAIE